MSFIISVWSYFGFLLKTIELVSFFFLFFWSFFLLSLSQMFLKSVPRNANGITKCLAPFVCWEH